jgi:ADP-heptose:LPS heptosyltransferase
MKKIAILIHPRKFLGDTIIYIPFLQNLRAQFPESTIIVYSTHPIINILSEMNLYDEVFLYERKKNLQIYKPLKVFNPDLIINFRTNNVLMNLICFSFRKAIKIGLIPNILCSFIYHYKLKNDRGLYQAQLFLKMLENPIFKPHFGFQKINELAKYEKKIPDSFKSKLNICFMPGGGAGEYKRWGIENFLALAELILQKFPNAHFHFVVGPVEEEAMKVVDKTLDKSIFTTYMSQTIPVLLYYIQQFDLIIGNDCGPSHLAQITESNYIGIWSWMKEDPNVFGGWARKSSTHHHIMAEQNQTIKTIAPQKVFAKAEKIIISLKK